MTTDNVLQALESLLVAHVAPIAREDLALDLIEPVNEALADVGLRKTMESSGLWEPVVLARQDDDQLPYQIIDGKRRVLAARQLGWATIRAEIFRAEDVPSLSAARLITNQQRSPNPADEYHALQAILRRMGDDYGLQDIATALSLNMNHLRKLLRLGNLSAGLFHLFESGKMAFGTALRAASLSPREQQRLLARSVDGKARITARDVSEVRQEVKDEAVMALDDRLFTQDEPTMEWFTAAMADLLERLAGDSLPTADTEMLRRTAAIIRRQIGEAR